jgi:DNA-binding CsgD family transcriptional regulator
LREAFAAAAEAAHRALFLAHLLEEVLAELPDADIAPPHATPTAKAKDVLPCGTDGLSQREREVLALVAAGLTNKAIAAALFVSPNTVKTHVASLLHKLRAQSRVHLATIASQCGLH